MRTPTRLALIAGVALTLTLAACGEDPSDADQGLQPPTTAPAATTTAAAGATTTKAPAAATTAAATTAKSGAVTTAKPIAINTVRIGDLSFGPQNITVPSGSTVTWTNADSINHSIVFEDGSVKSAVLIPGQTFSTTFTKVGTFKYYSGTVNYVTGSVIVTAAPTTAAGS